jgi:hypothetical protein
MHPLGRLRALVRLYRNIQKDSKATKSLSTAKLLPGYVYTVFRSMKRRMTETFSASLNHSRSTRTLLC